MSSARIRRALFSRLSSILLLFMSPTVRRSAAPACDAAQMQIATPISSNRVNRDNSPLFIIYYLAIPWVDSEAIREDVLLYWVYRTNIFRYRGAADQCCAGLQRRQDMRGFFSHQQTASIRQHNLTSVYSRDSLPKSCPAPPRNGL
uniref:Uncharacterized protein n=1 Tax=Candidatus Methanogaster sp. ANME-2c ERB4 TaxID=2759911 RepID=A0A7G9YAQ1_9EURY|nr:hypothetical protein GJDNBJFE_00001 [Methanosarcinales archaeon ANME-2c ERB4]